MELTDDQKQQVTRWIAEGQKLSDVQRRLDEEFGARLTYMETRFLMDDLSLTPQDPPEPVAPAPAAAVAAVETPAGGAAMAEEFSPDPLDALPAGAGGVKVKVDEITRPGSLVSGTVVFSDGGQAVWYLDQMGRLGMQAGQMGYRPPEPDVAEFQLLLERELAKLGL